MTSQHNRRVVELFDQHGNPFKYKRLSTRIPDFLRDYPANEYSVVISATDTLSLKPGLLALYQKCIESGKSFEDAGLPAYTSADSFVFTAQLMHNGVVVRQTSAVSRVREYKDYECGETAALQRLLAQLGYGGEVFDEDEDRDFVQQDLGTETSESDIPPVSQGQAEELPKPDAPMQTSDAINHVPRNLVDQIEHLASIKGMVIKPYKSLEEANQELIRLQQA